MRDFTSFDMGGMGILSQQSDSERLRTKFLPSVDAWGKPVTPFSFYEPPRIDFTNVGITQPTNAAAFSSLGSQQLLSQPHAIFNNSQLDLTQKFSSLLPKIKLSGEKPSVDWLSPKFNIESIDAIRPKLELTKKGDSHLYPMAEEKLHLKILDGFKDFTLSSGFKNVATKFSTRLLNSKVSGLGTYVNGKIKLFGTMSKFNENYTKAIAKGKNTNEAFNCSLTNAATHRISKTLLDSLVTGVLPASGSGIFLLMPAYYASGEAATRLGDKSQKICHHLYTTGLFGSSGSAAMSKESFESDITPKK